MDSLSGRLQVVAEKRLKKGLGKGTALAVPSQRALFIFAL
jgi:hypothetical protein